MSGIMERGFFDRGRKSSKKEEEEEERRFQAQLKEAMEKSLQEETSEPYVEDRSQMDQTIDQAKERFMGEVGASNTGNVFQALNESTGDGGGGGNFRVEEEKEDWVVGAHESVKSSSGASSNGSTAYNILKHMDVFKVYWQEYPNSISGGAYKADVYDKDDQTMTSVRLAPVVKRSKNWRRKDGPLTEKEHELTEGERREICKAKVEYFRELKKEWKKKNGGGGEEGEETAYKFRIQHPTTKEPHEFRYSPASGENLGEAGKEFLIQNKFPTDKIEKYAEKIVKKMLLVMAEKNAGPVRAQPEIRVPTDEDRKRIEELLWPGSAASASKHRPARAERQSPSLSISEGAATQRKPSPPVQEIKAPTKTTTTKPTLAKEASSNKTSNTTKTRSLAQIYKFNANDKDALVYMVKESQKLKYKRGSFKDFLEESTTLREQMKRTQDPNRHDWKTLNEYVLTLSDARVKDLYGKYEIFASGGALAAWRQDYEKYEKDERKLIEKRQKQQQLMQVQQQSQQQIKSIIETHFVSDQPRGNYPPMSSSISEQEPRQPTPEEQVQQQQIRGTQRGIAEQEPRQPTPEEQVQQQQIRGTQRGGTVSPRSPRKNNHKVSNAQPSSDDYTIAELREEIEILNREKNVLELENNHLKSENFMLLKENEKVKRNNERLLKMQDTMVNLQQRQQKPQPQPQQPSVWGLHIPSIPSADDTSSVSSHTNNNGFGSNEAQQTRNNEAFEESPWLDDLLNEESTPPHRSTASLPPGFEHAIHTPENVEPGGAYTTKTPTGWGQPP